MYTVSRDCQHGLSAGAVSKDFQQGLSAGTVSRDCQQGLSAGTVSKDCAADVTIERHGMTHPSLLSAYAARYIIAIPRSAILLFSDSWLGQATKPH